MQVLKFGGSSVANAGAMLQVIDIVKKALETDRTIVVSSAISGCTDELIAIGRLSGAHDKSFEERLQALRERHHQIVKELLPESYQAKTLETLDGLFAQLASILQGVFLLGELSPTSLSAVESFGELFSTKILTDKCQSLGIPCQWLDARKLVVLRGGTVDTTVTYKRIQEAVGQHLHTQLFIVPGFIARDEEGRPTTLGRGGSDRAAEWGYSRRRSRPGPPRARWCRFRPAPAPPPERGQRPAPPLPPGPRCPCGSGG